MGILNWLSKPTTGSSEALFNEANKHWKLRQQALLVDDEHRQRQELLQVITLCESAIDKSKKNGDAYVLMTNALVCACDLVGETSKADLLRAHAAAAIHKWWALPYNKSPITKHHDMGVQFRDEVLRMIEQAEHYSRQEAEKRMAQYAAKYADHAAFLASHDQIKAAVMGTSSGKQRIDGLERQQCMDYIAEEYKLVRFYTREFTLYTDRATRAAEASRANAINVHATRKEAQQAAARLACATEAMLKHWNNRADSAPKTAMTAFTAWQEWCRAACAHARVAESLYSPLPSGSKRAHRVANAQDLVADAENSLANIQEYNTLLSQHAAAWKNLEAAQLRASETLEELQERLGLTTTELNDLVSRASSFVDTITWQPGQALWDSTDAS